MPTILPNVLADTLRGLATSPPGSTVQGTSLPMLYLSRVPIHIEVIFSEDQYKVLRSGGIATTFAAYFGAEYDINEGDILARFTYLDNSTPWPDDRSTEATWHVKFMQMSAPFPLPQKTATITRVITQGTNFPF